MAAYDDAMTLRSLFQNDEPGARDVVTVLAILALAAALRVAMG